MLKPGDVIRTTTPMNCDAVTVRAGEYLHAQLTNHRDCAYADTLIASGRWVKVEAVPEPPKGE